MRINLVQEYTKAIIKHASNYFSICSLFLILLAWFLPFDINAKFQVTVLFAFSSIIYAGFSTWKDTISKLPTNEGVTISLKSKTFSPRAYYANGMLDPELKILIEIDIINNNNDLIILNRPEIIKFDLGSEMFKKEPKEINYFRTPNRYEHIIFPDKIPGHERELVTCVIGVLLLEQDSNDFAKQLKKLLNFEVDIKFEYEDMTPAKYSKVIHVKDSYQNFVEGIMQFWKKKELYELIYNATEHNNQ